MSELNGASLRKLLQDRQQKDAATSTAVYDLLLDTSLIEEAQALDEERLTALAPIDEERRAAKRAAEGSLGEVDHERFDKLEAAATKDVDARIAAVRDRVKAATIRLVFKSVSPTKYQQILNDLPEGLTDEQRTTTFHDRLTTACFRHALHDGEVTDLTWAEVQDQLNFGEADAIHALVFSANRRTVDIPFLSAPSGRIR
ncbi:hypothetical protein ACQCX2_17510 [Propionibacteriaceae bacterium Y1700]|uniref:hypothetical protein n=1 Tax=Microlunatus sp. Y1700 TaxID=3418487 RepID=UPI003DA71969